MSTRDHLPLVGPLPDGLALQGATGLGRDDRRPQPRLPGLWIATAFGGRGLLWSVLAAELIAARLEGEPAPLDRTLAAALATDRFLRRSRRAADTSG
jgi:tRNA 5-methylaminomethyl-2-thiouridine biosynthesis bifunctional protein